MTSPPLPRVAGHVISRDRDAASELRIEVITNLAGLDVIAAEWNALLAQSSANTIFLTCEWVATWWRVYGGNDQLYILAVRAKDGALVGLAPLRRIRRGLGSRDTVAFIGAGSDVKPEYLDIIIEHGWELPVIRIIVARLVSDAGLTELDLQPIAADSPTLAHLGALLAEGPGVLRHRPGSTCPFLSLPETVEQFKDSRSRNYRKKLGEFERRCERELRAQLRLSSTADEVNRDLSTLKDLHGLRWNGASRAFQSREYVAFHDSFAQLALARGWLRLYSLDSDGRPLAMIYCYHYAGRFYFYQSGRDPSYSRQHVGLVLMHKVILEAIREGAAVFDFLSGDEPYKYRWATGKRMGSRMLYWRSMSSWMVSLCREQLGLIATVHDRIFARDARRGDWESAEESKREVDG